MSTLALFLAFLAIVLSALTGDDTWMNAAGLGLVIDALLFRVANGIRNT